MQPQDFLPFAELFRQPTFLVDSSGRVLGANRPAHEKFGAPGRLQTILDTPPEALAEFLRRCARTRNRCAGAFALFSGARCQLDGCLVQPRTDSTAAVIAVRFLSESESGAAFHVLNHDLKAIRHEMAERSHVQAELRREREWLRVTLMSIGDAVIATDLAGRVELMNPIAQSLTGWTESEALGLPLSEIFHIVEDGSQAPVPSPVDEVLEGGANATLPRHTLLLSRDGSRWPIDDSAAPIRNEDGAVIGSVLVFREVTERRRLENLAASRMEELAESSRRKDEFLGMLAHELRNPLAPILTSAAILKAQPTSRAGIEWTASLIERQATHMVRLVDDLLDISRVTRGRIELHRETIDLTTMLQQAVETVRGDIDAREHELVWEVPDQVARVEADPTRLEQVFTNLLQNAAKFTPPHGTITVTARVEGSEVVVSVKDCGIGIAPVLLDRVFDLFAQGDCGLDRSGGGLGIGLTLVKQLVTLHGGSVSAHSAGPGEGSEFIVRLPCMPAESVLDAKSAATRVRPPRTPRRVLVVDDNVDAAESLELLLRSMGHTVFVAYDGPSAIELAESERPDVILLDIGLPGMDGYETAKRLKSNPRTSSAACIALTGYGQEEHRQRSLALGFVAHLTKPVETETLSRLMSECASGVALKA